MKPSPLVSRRRNSNSLFTPRPISMYVGPQLFKPGQGDFRGSTSSLVMDEPAKSPNLQVVKELKRMKRNSSTEFLNPNSLPVSDFGFGGRLTDLNESAEGVSDGQKKKAHSSRQRSLPSAGPGADTWYNPKSIKKLGIAGNVFGVHISKSGTCYASVVTEKGDRLIQAFDRGGNLVKSFHMRTTKGGKPFEPYQIDETPDGHLAVACGSCVTVWSKEGKLLTEHGKNLFKFAKCLAVRSTGEIVVTDTDNESVKLISSTGQQINKLSGEFVCPVGVAVDSNDYIIVSDWKGKISVYDADNVLIKIFGVKGKNPGEIDLPYGVSVDAENNIVVADMWNHRLSVFTQNGRFLKNLASEPGQSIHLPAHISVASKSSSNDYRFAVTDFGANAVKIFTF